MNIIEAIQKAENGALIANGTMKRTNSFISYIKNGVFFKHEVINGQAHYQYEFRTFPMAYILDTSWEIVPDKFLIKIK